MGIVFGTVDFVANKIKANRSTIAAVAIRPSLIKIVQKYIKHSPKRISSTNFGISDRCEWINGRIGFCQFLMQCTRQTISHHDRIKIDTIDN